jgi:hypothetical protein
VEDMCKRESERYGAGDEWYSRGGGGGVGGKKK